MHRRHTSPHVKIFNDLLIAGHAWTDEGHLFFIIWGFIRERFRKTIQNKEKKSERGGESTKLTSISSAMYCFVFCCGDFRNSLYLKMKMEKKLQKSIHPSIFCHLSSGSSLSSNIQSSLSPPVIFTIWLQLCRQCISKPVEISFIISLFWAQKKWQAYDLQQMNRVWKSSP